MMNSRLKLRPRDLRNGQNDLRPHTRYCTLTQIRRICYDAHVSTPHVSPSGRLAARSQRGTSRGFTILEVGMAAAVLAMALATSITVLQRAYLMMDTARNLTLAGQIMVTEIEKLRMQDYSALPAAGASDTVTIDSTFTSNPKIADRFTVMRTASEPVTDIRQITYSISWKSYDGRLISRSYTTYYARYGIHDYLYNTM
jgi:type II secretory pathway pseudopilin PulG